MSSPRVVERCRATWRVLDFTWLASAVHVLAPAIASYGLAHRHPTDEHEMPALIGLGSGVAVLLIGFLLWVASVTAGNLQ